MQLLKLVTNISLQAVHKCKYKSVFVCCVTYDDHTFNMTKYVLLSGQPIPTENEVK